MNYKIAAIVVTFNRLELLKQCIQSIRNQTYKLNEIIIVNNSCTDGTLDWLNQQTDLTVITQENSGSAGGQYTGIKTAFEKGYDWIWCLDTDVVPNLDALEMLLNSEVINNQKTGFLSSTIFYKDGNLCRINLPYIKDSYSVIKSLSEFSTLSILSASFGSVLFSRKAIEKVGYPISDFFIWGDDVEYTFRMIEAELYGYLVFSSRAKHFAPNNFIDPFLEMNFLDKKSFYCVRNSVYIIKLRKKILSNSDLNGIISCLSFYFFTLIKRFKSKNWNIYSLLLFTNYFLRGLFYNPRKYLKNQNV